jgi:hypothetical protein
MSVVSVGGSCSLFVVSCRVSAVKCCLLIVGCWMSTVFVSSWLSNVGCRVLVVVLSESFVA